LVDVSTCDATLLVRVEGEVDIANVAQVERAAMEAVVRARPRALILDLAPLEYLDGAGRTWIQGLGVRLAACGVDLEIRRPLAGPAARMFDLVWPVSDRPSD
jgi:anti-anti-sigma factor